MNAELRTQLFDRFPLATKQPSPAPTASRRPQQSARREPSALESAQARIAELEAQLKARTVESAELARALTAIAEHKDQEAAMLRKAWSAEYCCGYVEARVASGDIARNALITSGIRKGYSHGQML